MPVKPNRWLTLVGATVMMGGTLVATNTSASAADQGPGSKIVSEAQYVAEEGETATSALPLGRAGIAGGPLVNSFAKEIGKVSGLQLSGTPVTEEYEKVGRTLTVTLTDWNGLEKLKVTRISVEGNVPESVISDGHSTLKKTPLSGGSTLMTAEGTENNTAATLTADGQLTIWSSASLEGTNAVKVEKLAGWAQGFAGKYNSKISVDVAPQPLARPSCSVEMRPPFTSGGNVFASSSLWCDQLGTARITAYIDQYRGLGYWLSKASQTGEDTNLSSPNITRIPNWTCAAGTGNQLYRGAVLTRQLVNANGTWYGTNRISGPEARLTCG
ncbi:hypothetical protein [Streptomyces goshikiensis]|uniref:hypothetical protein n=1 Tax=Streptomyces goshikiensis TaxID=1942 RepID=UPI002E0FDDAC|nr:hypothetical protein OG224_39340 [Streptomyces goshikiensis]